MTVVLIVPHEMREFAVAFLPRPLYVAVGSEAGYFVYQSTGKGLEPQLFADAEGHALFEVRTFESEAAARAFYWSDEISRRTKSRPQ